MEVSKAMLHDQELPMFLWGEATNVVVYVQSRHPHQILDQNTPKEIFTGERQNVEHLRIFGCLVYVHVLKEKWINLEPSRKKGNFIGYRKYSKAFKVYILGKLYIETYKDIVFDEDVVFWKFKGSHLDSDEEVHVAPKNVESKSKEPEPMDQDTHEESDFHEIIEFFRATTHETRKRLPYLKITLKEVEGHVAAHGTFRESKKQKKYFRYTTLMCNIIYPKPSTYEEDVEEQVWKYDMTK